jgi:hypothetical protein
LAAADLVIKKLLNFDALKREEWNNCCFSGWIHGYGRSSEVDFADGL